MEPSIEWFVEQVGMSAERDGLPRIAGRLFGFLLLSPAPRTLDDIAAALGVSKGSVSTDARLLLGHGWLQRTSLPGDRRDYYEMAPDFFARIVAYRLSRWDALHDLVADARRRLPRQPRTIEQRLQYLDEVQRFFREGVLALLSEWSAHAAGAPRRPPAKRVVSPARTPRARLK